jgi:hypothetical protein
VFGRRPGPSPSPARQKLVPDIRYPVSPVAGSLGRWVAGSLARAAGDWLRYCSLACTHGSKDASSGGGEDVIVVALGLLGFQPTVTRVDVLLGPATILAPGVKFHHKRLTTYHTNPTPNGP